MDLGHDLVHLGGGEGPNGCCVHVANRSQVQEYGHGGLIIGGFENQYSVVFTQRPIDVRHLRPQLLRGRFKGRRPLRAFVDPFDALLSELDVGDECDHFRLDLLSGERVNGANDVCFAYRRFILALRCVADQPQRPFLAQDVL